MPETSATFSVEEKPNNSYVAGFDSLRFFAASAVLLCQIELLKHYSGLPSLVSESSIYETGKLLVASFFVLSGFLITTLLLLEKERHGTIRILSFYMRRGLRIWPLYYLLILLVFFVLPKSQIFYLPLQSEELQQHFALKFIFCLLLMPQMLLLKFRSIPGGEQLWTIGTEEVFYLLWPLFLWHSKNALRLTVSAIVVFALAKYLLYHFSGNPVWTKHPSLLYKAFLVLYYNRIDCILMGAIAATLVKQKNPFWLGITSHLKYIVPIIFSLIGLYWIGLNFIPVDYFFYSICFAFILSFIAVTKGQVTNIVLRFAEKMGKMTYGIYLWHFITILIAFTLLNYFFAEADRNSIAANAFLYFTSFALTYVVAFLSYRFFELPFLKLKRKFKV